MGGPQAPLPMLPPRAIFACQGQHKDTFTRPMEVTSVPQHLTGLQHPPGLRAVGDPQLPPAVLGALQTPAAQEKAKERAKEVQQPDNRDELSWDDQRQKLTVEREGDVLG